MTVVLTNDDGIAAPGFQALELACRGWCEPIVVAPDRCHSSMSHHVNTGAPLVVAELAPNRFQVAASPADCARLAFACLAPQAQWLFSGINRGGNLGMDTCYSGTVAAAREAALLGTPAIAISHYVTKGREVDWIAAAGRAARVLTHLTGEPISKGDFWNVNLPHPAIGDAEPELVFCALDPSALPVKYIAVPSGYRYSGDYASRKRLPGCDVAECFRGAITATRMRVSNGF